MRTVLPFEPLATCFEPAPTPRLMSDISGAKPQRMMTTIGALLFLFDAGGADDTAALLFRMHMRSLLWDKGRVEWRAHTIAKADS